MLSPISQNLFDRMRISVLKRVDELLFSSSKPRRMTKVVRKVRDLTPEKNLDIYDEICTDLLDGKVPPLSTYRISLFLFGEWQEGQDLKFLTPTFKEEYFADISSVINDFEMYDYLSNLRIEFGNEPILFTPTNDFYLKDIESHEEKFEILSELEEKRIEVFKEYLDELKPVLRKGIVQSLKYSSDITISDRELIAIYSLLGYFSTDTGREFLYNLDDPELIRRARKLGDFSGLKKKITT
jgi:hypothetical protein